jgi:hypothetical protein
MWMVFATKPQWFLISIGEGPEVAQLLPLLLAVLDFPTGPGASCRLTIGIEAHVSTQRKE